MAKLIVYKQKTSIKVAKNMRNYAYESFISVERCIIRLYYGDIKHINDQKLKDGLSNPHTFAAFEQQISDIQCDGIRYEDDIRKVDQLLSISNNLNSFLLKYTATDPESKDGESLSDYQIQQVAQLLETVNIALEKAKAVCVSNSSYDAVSTLGTQNILGKTSAVIKNVKLYKVDNIRELNKVDIIEIMKKAASKIDEILKYNRKEIEKIYAYYSKYNEGGDRRKRNKPIRRV